MGSPAVSRFLYKGEYSEQNTKVKRIFGEEISVGVYPPCFCSVCVTYCGGRGCAYPENGSTQGACFVMVTGMRGVPELRELGGESEGKGDDTLRTWGAPFEAQGLRAVLRLYMVVV